jgi:hypothetical protein
MESQDFTSRRKHYRHSLRNSVSVTSLSSDESVGILVNLSMEGLMLVHNRPLPADCIHQLRLVIAEGVIDGGPSCEIQMGVDCLWTSPAEGMASMYWSGCQIIDVSDKDYDLIQKLIQAVGD